MTSAVRWGGLIAWAAVTSAALTLAPGRAADPRPSRREAPAPESPPASLDHPPEVSRPNPEQVRRLEAAARRLAPAVMYVGHPDGDSGTAFVISRKHRLLATNAHVAPNHERGRRVNGPPKRVVGLLYGGTCLVPPRLLSGP